MAAELAPSLVAMHDMTCTTSANLRLYTVALYSTIHKHHISVMLCAFLTPHTHMPIADCTTANHPNHHPQRYSSADLKGKGEPTQPTIPENSSSSRPGGFLGRQRSISAGTPGASENGQLSPLGSNATMAGVDGNAGGLKRSNTTGKRFAEGLKRRFSSLRRKPVSEQQ